MSNPLRILLSLALIALLIACDSKPETSPSPDTESTRPASSGDADAVELKQEKAAIPEPKPIWQQYENTALGIRFAFPPELDLLDDRDGRFVFALNSNKRDQLISLHVEQQPRLENSTPRDESDRSLAAYRSQKGFKLVRHERSDWPEGGKGGIRYSNLIGFKKRFVSLNLFLTETTAVAFTYKAQDPVFRRNSAFVSDIMKTLETIDSAAGK